MFAAPPSHPLYSCYEHRPSVCSPALPALAITAVRVLPGYPQYLEWTISNTGNTDTFVTPNAIFYKPTTITPYYAKLGTATALYAYDSSMGSLITVYLYAGYGWFNAINRHTYRIFSGSVVPGDAKWAVYNVNTYCNGKFSGWLYQSLKYATLR